MKKIEKRILDILKKSKMKLKNKQIRGALYLQFGKIQPEHIREHMHSLRLEGEPILSDNEGYWYSHDTREIEACMESLEKRANEIFEVAEALKENLK